MSEIFLEKQIFKECSKFFTFNFFSARLLCVFIFFSLISYYSSAQSVEKNSPRLVIIIDDLGNNSALSQRAARLPGAITLSILPETTFGPSIAQIGHSLGKEIMLHVPMSNTHSLPLGNGGLYGFMTQDDLIKTLRRDLNSLPYVKGVNNHMGSQLTQERHPMEWVMGEMRSRGLYFVDSRTSNKTLAYEIALQMHVPALKRDIFLDDDTDPVKIQEQLYSAVKLAKQKGFAVAIGHPHLNTLDTLEANLGKIRQAGVSLAYASELFEAATQAPTPENSALITSEPINYCPVLPYFAWPQPKQDAPFSDLLHRTLVDWLTVH